MPHASASFEVYSVNLTSSEILACRTAPTLVVPAPGAGKSIVPVSAVYKLTYGTTPYSGQASLYWSGSSGYVADTGDQEVLQQLVDSVAMSTFIEQNLPLASFENQAIYYSSGSLTVPQGGDGTLMITVLCWIAPI